MDLDDGIVAPEGTETVDAVVAPVVVAAGVSLAHAAPLASANATAGATSAESTGRRNAEGNERVIRPPFGVVPPDGDWVHPH